MLIKLKWIFSSFGRIFNCFIILPLFIYCSVFAIKEFGLAGIFLIFMGLVVGLAVMSLCDFIS